MILTVHWLLNGRVLNINMDFGAGWEELQGTSCYVFSETEAVGCGEVGLVVFMSHAGRAESTRPSW